ncbi:hypothetical protein K9N68_00575 [Kovacikia minuta CCNUW1]|uniref:hypothetical protein n=1 Tax=Kovacikia minuta TaxID=2931930 RepID=UPI001CCACF6A|nr:hypothetical protein [Kovacikia minuta]UBF26543.1 hypothetical protein K9N68_00575 [Kovacikia minuta CCNUW1]
MSGQLCWLSTFGADGQLTLHLRLEPNQPWKPYTTYPALCMPDYPIPGGSKGWATSQKLLRAGWTLVSIHQAQKSSISRSSVA